jgi:hypothetical protein
LTTERAYGGNASEAFFVTFHNLRNAARIFVGGESHKTKDLGNSKSRTKGFVAGAIIGFAIDSMGTVIIDQVVG